jgi:hypothetical protein
MPARPPGLPAYGLTTRGSVVELITLAPRDWDARGFRYHNVTAHPALISFCNRSPRWKLTSKATGLSKGGFKRKGGRQARHRSDVHLFRKQGKARRLATFTFEYIPVRTA